MGFAIKEPDTILTYVSSQLKITEELINEYQELGYDTQCLTGMRNAYTDVREQLISNEIK